MTQTDTTPITQSHDWSMLSSVSIDDIINSLAQDIAQFAIHLALAIALFYIGRFLINKLYAFTSKVLHRRDVDLSLSTFVLSLIRIVLYFILLIIVIGILGINTSSFLALFASAGVAIGMALSGTLQNFAGGVLILLLKPYRVGDFIEAQGYSGIVKEIQIFSTIINTPDNKSIIIPNGPLSTGSINNWSREQYRRIDWTVSISYGDSVDTARAVILDIINSDERVYNSTTHTLNDTTLPTRTNLTQPVVLLSNMADSSVELSIRAWVKSTDYWDVYFSLNETIYNTLPQHGINFPFPQMDVHMKSDTI